MIPKRHRKSKLIVKVPILPKKQKKCVKLKTELSKLEENNGKGLTHPADDNQVKNENQEIQYADHFHDVTSGGFGCRTSVYPGEYSWA